MSFLFSLALVEASLAGSSLDGNALVPWNVKTTQVGFSPKDRTTAILILSRFGMTCEPSAQTIPIALHTSSGSEASGVNSLSLEDSLAKTSVLPGRGAGIDGERSGLWREMGRIIGEIRPARSFVENSPMLTVRGLGRVLGDLAAMGYDAQWGIVSAADAIWLDGTPCLGVSQTLPVAIGGPLNPEWTEWLMGWPMGQTDLRPLETDKFRAWLSSHGRF